jgi:hypothetical protein
MRVGQAILDYYAGPAPMTAAGAACGRSLDVPDKVINARIKRVEAA